VGAGMSELKFTESTMKYLAYFESLTGTKVYDCVEFEDNEKLVFIVPQHALGAAIGRKGEVLRRLKKAFKKDVELIGYSKNREQFIRNIFHDYAVGEVRIESRGDKEIAYVTMSMRDKARAIGKGGKKLARARAILQRHHKGLDLVITS
jgi:N utilization substance protein A